MAMKLTLYAASLAVALRKENPQATITAYVRSSKSDQWLQSTAGIDRIIRGTFEESDKIRKAAVEHDIVINAASSFDPQLTAAILAGLKSRDKSSRGTLIHLSGGGNFIDDTTTGMFNPNGRVWNVCLDLTMGPIESAGGQLRLDRITTRMISGIFTRACSMERLIRCKTFPVVLPRGHL
jgi:hypothetical protein